jgi:1A family penicillin-binding protein
MRKKIKELKKKGFIVRKRKKKKKLKKIFFFLFFSGIFLAIAFIGYVFYLYNSLPNPENFGERIVEESTKIYDRTEKILLYEIHGKEKRTIISLEQIPKHTQQSVISIEDIEFYQHPAFDWRAILRAVVNNIVKGRITQGGSTITQQLAKNAFLTSEKTIIRKIKDILLAIKLEKKYTKDQILEFYLNQIPFGSNLYGIESASKAYFDKKAEELTIAQSAILSAMIQSPTYYSPYGENLEKLKNRQKYILNRMNLYGFIDEEQLESSLNEELIFQSRATDIKAPHFVMFIKKYLESKYDEEFIKTGGLKVITTLNWEMQQIAEKAVKEGAERNEKLYKGKNAALIAQDPKTGQILSMVGSKNYFDIENEGNFNVITAHRQPGSSFKPFAYLAAFEKGYLPETTIFNLKTDFNATGIESEKYQPENFDHQFTGPITFRNALAQSVNVPAVKVLYLSGISRTIQIAKKLGITTLNDISKYGLSLVLGGGDVKPIDMAKAYSVFARDGIMNKQKAILRIEDSKGRVIEKYENESERVFDSKYIRMLNDILSDNEARIGLFNPNNLLVIPNHQVAAKTGTTQDYRDAWVFGYTPALVVGVWAGNNDFSPMQEGGGSILAAVPIWNNFISQVLKNYPTETFPKPEYPEKPNKPMLSGEYLAYYKIDEKLFPQIHNILYWIDKKKPLAEKPENPENDFQFENWEKPVIEWIKENFANYEEFNQFVPEEFAKVINLNDKQEIKILSPKNGDFIKNTNISLKLEINSETEIKLIKIYFNNILISQTNNFKGNELSLNIIPQKIDSQNEIRVEILDNFGNKKEDKIIVFN